MNARIIVLVLIAGVAAIGAMIAANSWLASQREALQGDQPAPREAVDSVQVLVAANALPAGTLITPNSLRWQPWPEESLDPNYIQQNAQNSIESYAGSVVRRGIGGGEPITPGRLVKPGDQGFMAAVLSPGMRAVTVSVNATTGISGFVFPGDRVDMILTHSITAGAEGAPTRQASETVMANVRVIGIDQSTNDQDGLPSVAKTVTLEVTPKQAEVVTLLAELGKLSLSLRSLQPAKNAHLAGGESDGEANPDTAIAVTAADVASGAAPEDGGPRLLQSAALAELERSIGYTWDSEVSVLLGGGQASQTVRIIRGSNESAVDFAGR